MITRIVVPQAFENMEEATIGAWHKSEGDAVSRGDALCELITEKTTFPLEAEADGVLLRVIIAPKSIVPVGTILGAIGDTNDALPDLDVENAAIRARAKQTESALLDAGALDASRLSVPNLSSTRIEPAAAAPGGSRVRATPAARRAARDKGVAIEDVARAFPDKVLSEDDVKNFEL